MLIEKDAWLNLSKASGDTLLTNAAVTPQSHGS